jgi:CRP/FNR family transcriptional regulator
MPRKEAISDCINCPIRSVSIFAGFSLEEVRNLNFPVHTVGYSAGEAFYHEGASPQAAFTIKSGVVKLVKELSNGRTQIVRLLTTGDIFGFEGLMDTRYHHTAIALNEAHVCHLSLSDLIAVCRDNPHVNEAILHRWAQALKQTEDLLVELGTKKANERLASFIVSWCEHSGMEGWTALPLTRQELAELLGLTVETVSRILADWKRKHYLEEKQGAIRLNPKKDLMQQLVKVSP